MARITDPVPDEEIEALQEEMQEQRVEVREQLAEDLGGDPDDYRGDRYLADQADERGPEGGE